MKLGILISGLILAVAISAQELLLGISDAGANVDLNVAGSPGVHQIQSKTNLAAPDWTQETGLTAETNISRAKDTTTEFFRAVAAPAHYNNHLSLGLSEAEIADLIEYLKAL